MSELTELAEREDLELRYEASRIAYNEHSKWWHSLTDSHRRALLKGTLSMSEEAFQAGVFAALRTKNTPDSQRGEA